MNDSDAVRIHVGCGKGISRGSSTWISPASLTSTSFQTCDTFRVTLL